MVQHPAPLLEDAVGATIQFLDRLVHRHAPVRDLLADEPGLGKTAQALLAAQTANACTWSQVLPCR